MESNQNFFVELGVHPYYLRNDEQIMEDFSRGITSKQQKDEIEMFENIMKNHPYILTNSVIDQIKYWKQRAILNNF